MEQVQKPYRARVGGLEQSSSELRATDTADITGCANGETLRIGDPNPTDENALEMVADDMSGFLQSRLGAVFPQKGIVVAIAASSSAGPAQIGLSAYGAVGSADSGNALGNNTTAPVPTSVVSPISNSNLVFIRGRISGGATDQSQFAYIRILGVCV
jgi:hypothetical protein